MAVKKGYILILPPWIPAFEGFEVANDSLSKFAGKLHYSFNLEYEVKSALYGGFLKERVSLNGEEVEHLDKFFGALPFLPKLQNAIALSKRALKRELEFLDYVSDLDKLGLPTDLRDRLVNTLFDPAVQPTGPESVPKEKATNGSPKTNGHGRDEVDSILEAVALPEESKQKISTAVELFAQTAGLDNTGFILKEDTGKDFIGELEEFYGRIRGEILNHSAVSRVLDLWMTLGYLARKIRSRRKQRLFVFSSHHSEIYKYSCLDYFLSEGGVVEAIALYPHSELFPPETLKSWEETAQHVRAPLFVEGPTTQEAPTEWPRAMQAGSSYGRTYLFSGRVAMNMPNKEEEIHGWKPSSIAFLEGLAAGDDGGWQAEGGLLRLENQGVIVKGGRSHVTGNILSHSEWDTWLERGINLVNSEWNTDVALFKPLVSLGSARFS